MLSVATGAATVTATYDALGRIVENNSGGIYTEFLYGPTGAKLASVHGTTLVKALIALPGGAKAVYNSAGLAYYRHSDWLRSSRLSSTATAPSALYSSTAYAPFGEQYATSGNADASFTGQDQTNVSSLYDFTFRESSPSQGRWISPDPLGRAAARIGDPQSWNRYAYVKNNPLSLVDPLGLDDESGGGEGGGDGCTWDDSTNTLDCGGGGGPDPSPSPDPTGGGSGGGGGNPTQSPINKQQLLLGLLSPDCNAMYGGLSNAVRDLTATQYTSTSSFNDTSTYGQEALRDATADFAANPSAVADTQYFNWDSQGTSPPSSTTFLAYTFIQPSFYSLSAADQLGNLFHELKHAAGYGAEIDAPPGLTEAQFNQFWTNEYQNNAQKCSPQQVPTEPSQLDGSIQ